MSKNCHYKFGPFQFARCGSVSRLVAFGKDLYMKIGSSYYIFGMRVI